ncbi:hypothetical protein ABIB48_001714 [Arthrobacter sp. UYCu511]
MTESLIRTPLLLGTALAALLILVFFFRRSPKSMMTVWAATLFCVPIWLGAQVGVFYSAITVVTLLVIASSSVHGFRFSVVDFLVGSFATLVILGWALGWVQWGHLVIVCWGWMIPYMGGRLMPSRVNPQWIYSCIATGALAASCLAIAEFLSGKNLFVLIKLNNNLYQAWHTLRYRGGELRVEGAFGQSIALSASLAMCSVFILVVCWPQWLKLLSLLILATAVGLTFSRIGMIVLLLTLVIGLLTLHREMLPAFRWKVAGFLAAGSLVGLPLLAEVFSAAGSEATGSAAYREEIFSLFDTASFLGLAKSWTASADGKIYYGTFQSIDSELVLTALRFGLIPVFLLIGAIICCVLTVMFKRATPAAVAVTGMIPAFATVALITQYATLAWFLAGLAVATYPRAVTTLGAGALALTTHTRPSTATTTAPLKVYGEEAPWLRS